jgi:hypothetical protein
MAMVELEVPKSMPQWVCVIVDLRSRSEKDNGRPKAAAAQGGLSRRPDRCRQ